MATIMEQLGLLEFFLPLFTLLFIFVVCYAVLAKTNILGPNKWLSALAAGSVSMLFLFTPELMETVKVATPWFIIFVIFLLLLFSLFMFLGVKGGAMAGVLENPSVHWTILIIVLIIFIGSLTYVFGSPVQQIYGVAGEEETEGGIMGDIGEILFHPKLLGALFILIIASQAIRLIAHSQ